MCEHQVMEVDLLSHKARIVKGEKRFFGRTIDGHISPDLLFGTVHPDDQNAFLELIEASPHLTAGEEYCFSFRVLHADGSYRNIWGISRPVRWDRRGLAVLLRSDVFEEP